MSWVEYLNRAAAATQGFVEGARDLASAATSKAAEVGPRALNYIATSTPVNLIRFVGEIVQVALESNESDIRDDGGCYALRPEAEAHIGAAEEYQNS